MKDKDGFTIPCVNAYWEIYDARDNKDFICRGDSENYGWFCNLNDKCPGYEPDMKIAKKRGVV